VTRWFRVAATVTAIFVLVLVAPSLTVLGPNAQVAGSHTLSPRQSYPSNLGVCINGGFQCSPAVPPPTVAVSLLGIGVLGVLTRWARPPLMPSRLRRKRAVSESLPSGFRVPVLRPPRGSF
jgi:hypothetical protein